VIECSTGVNHNAVISWAKQVGEQLPDALEDDLMLQLAQVDEVQTFERVPLNNGSAPAAAQPT